MTLATSIDCLHIVLNSVTYDSRVLKETRSVLASAKVRRLEIAGMHEQGDNPRDDLGDGRTIRRFELTTRPWPKNLVVQTLKYAEFYWRVVRYYRLCPLRVVHAHDLSALPIAARLARETGARLVYDAHELQTETRHARGMRQSLSRRLEGRLIARADAMITVSPSIRDWYHQRYPDVPIHLVRNVPERDDGTIEPVPLREQLEVPEDALLFLYLGGIGAGRGIQNTVEAFLDEGVKHHILFMGNGPLEGIVDEAAARCPRIHRHAPVPPSEVLAYATGADAGVCLYEDTCLNHRYCLPNKLFESLLAGLPVLASNLPDQARIVEEHGAGWVVENTVESITERLRTLTAGEGRAMREGLSERVADLSWDNEAKELLGIYRALLE